MRKINLALGYACNIKELFVRFPYNKIKSLITKFKTLAERKRVTYQVFRECLHLVINDVIENNITFKISGVGRLTGEIHMEAITNDDFVFARKHGKFKEIDFLESVFTGYLMYLFVHDVEDKSLKYRKIPIYFSKVFKDKLIKYTNLGKQYC